MKVLRGKENKNILKPRQHAYDSVFVVSDRGNISVSALDWLQKYGIPLTFLTTNGKIRNQTIDYQANGRLRIKQFASYQNNRLEIGKEIIRAKIKRQDEVLHYLKQRYEVKNTLEQQIKDIDKAKTIESIRGIEGISANRYWQNITDILGFESRDNGFTHRPMSAIERENSLFNYGYSVLAGMIRQSLNKAGFETSIGYIHEIASGKEPLVYDWQEPYRFLIDLTVIRMLENKILKNGDYGHTKDWVIILKKAGISKILDEIRLTFNTPVKFKGKSYKRDTVIDLQIKEFANHLTDDKSFELSKPELNLVRTDNADMREKIKNMTYGEWKAKGYSKGSLHYLKHNVDKPSFKVYGKINKKFNSS